MPARAPFSRRLCAWLAALAWLIAWLPMARADSESLEAAVKATYLYKFAPFVEWPDPGAEFPGGAFSLCVVGDPLFGSLLERAVAGQDVAGRPIAVHRYATISGNPGCAMMFVTGSPAQPVGDVLALVRGMPVLTVTDGAHDPDAHGIINFIVADNRVRFEIDEAAAAANRLAVSSKLLALATRVIPRSR